MTRDQFIIDLWFRSQVRIAQRKIPIGKPHGPAAAVVIEVMNEMIAEGFEVTVRHLTELPFLRHIVPPRGPDDTLKSIRVRNADSEFLEVVVVWNP